MADHNAEKAQCDGPVCDEPSVAIATTGCIREHIVVAKVCKAHADRAQERANLDNLWCFECGPMGQRTRVRLRLSPGMRGPDVKR